MSSLVRRRIGWHDDFVDVAFTGEMPGHFVGLDIGTGASFLMIALAIIASRTGMPDGHVVSTRVTVVMVVVPLVGIRRVLAVVGWRRRRRNACRRDVCGGCRWSSGIGLPLPTPVAVVASLCTGKVREVGKRPGRLPRLQE